MADGAPNSASRTQTDGAAGHPLLPLVARNLEFSINGRKIINDVSFRIDSSGRTVILGPNGAGKSVMLRLCHGLLKPTRGEIRWGQLSVAAARGQQAMTSQQPVLLRRTVNGNLMHVLRVKGVPRDARHGLVEAALEQAGLADFGARAARTLSGGQQQRLAIARAFVLRPRVLLLDEPTANLDPAAVRSVEELIGAISAAGTKILMTTHDIAQARRLAADVMFLHQGRLLEHAPATEFFASPRDPVAAGFLAGELPA